jgi:nicotinate-nucleotide pyrophosphorylase (carboxylating)
VNPRIRTELEAVHLDADDVARLIDIALEEDLRYGPDITSDATIAADAVATGDVVARAPGVLCGVPVALGVLDALGIPLEGIEVVAHDGEAIASTQVLFSVTGPLRKLLVAERTLLNFMTHLSGVATATRAWRDALEGTNCQVRDTRKTTPGFRQLEKYAVRCGGGVNHRMGLGDGALIKDNHLAAVGGLTEALRAVRAVTSVEVEVECDTLDQVREAVDAGCSLILLDNMTIEQLTAAVAIARVGTDVRLEASGGMTLEAAREVAATGVDYIAVGSLTHSSPGLDMALDLRAR